MKFHILIYITLIISSLSVQPIYPEPYDIIAQYTLNEPLLQGPSSGNKYKITKISQKTIFLENGEETMINFTLKAINLPKRYFLNSFILKFPNKGEFIYKNALFRKKNAKYIFKRDEFHFLFKLFNNEEIDIKLKYKTKNDNIFKLYRCEYIKLPVFNLGIPGEIYIKGKGNITVFGTKFGKLKKKQNYNSYYWKGIIKSKDIFDYVFIGYKTAKWIGRIKGIIKSNKNIDSNAEFHIFPYFLGGNNKIHNYEVSNNIAKKIDGINIIQKDNQLIFKSKMNKNLAYFLIKAKFSNYISSNWKIKTLLSNNEKIKNINLFKQKAREIILKDKSNTPNYIKLGRWVNKNIQYDINDLGKKMSVEEILKRKKGVCEHFTLLYNALLNSIGIQAIYVRGYAFQRKEDLKINKNTTTHAWTIAKINNQWIPLDSTWGILEGKLPVTHVFIEYEKGSILFYKCPDCSTDFIQDIKFLGFDQSMIRKM